jgi:hypothetical protein
MLTKHGPSVSWPDLNWNRLIRTHTSRAPPRPVVKTHTHNTNGVRIVHTRAYGLMKRTHARTHAHRDQKPMHGQKSVEKSVCKRPATRLRILCSATRVTDVRCTPVEWKGKRSSAAGSGVRRAPFGVERCRWTYRRSPPELG